MQKLYYNSNTSTHTYTHTHTKDKCLNFLLSYIRYIFFFQLGTRFGSCFSAYCFLFLAHYGTQFFLRFFFRVNFLFSSNGPLTYKVTTKLKLVHFLLHQILLYILLNRILRIYIPFPCTHIHIVIYKNIPLFTSSIPSKKTTIDMFRCMIRIKSFQKPACALLP